MKTKLLLITVMLLIAGCGKTGGSASGTATTTTTNNTPGDYSSCGLSYGQPVWLSGAGVFGSSNKISLKVIGASNNPVSVAGTTVEMEALVTFKQSTEFGTYQGYPVRLEIDAPNGVCLSSKNANFVNNQTSSGAIDGIYTTFMAMSAANALSVKIFSINTGALMNTITTSIGITSHCLLYPATDCLTLTNGSLNGMMGIVLKDIQLSSPSNLRTVQ